MLMFREYVHRGRRLSETHSFAPAVREMDRAIAIYPKQAEGYVQRAIVHKESGDDFKAIEDYNRALGIDSTDSSVHYDLAQALRRVNLGREAVREYDLAIRYDPNMLQAYNNLGVTLRELGLMEQAAVVFRKATEIAPSYVKAFNNLGALYVRQGEFRKAADVLEKGLEIDPTMFSASALLGISRYQMGDYAAARAPLEKAVRANAKDAHARRFLASSFHLPDRKGELLAMLALELGERLEESELAALEREALGNPPILVLRIRLARALNAGIPQLREAIAALDAGDHVADAARATAMLALRTRDERDQADAARRLDALGDRAYRQRLAEDWTAA